MTIPVVPADIPARHAAHEGFLTSGRMPAGVRRVVAASWRRSARVGVDPDRLAPRMDTSAVDLLRVRDRHPLAVAIPVVRDLLVEPAVEWVAALTDERGRLLWIEGDRAVRRQTERAGFVEGADWSEPSAGTNAPGTALATGEAVRVLGAEHWARPVHGLNCVAVPLRDAWGAIVGVLDITGGAAVASDLARTLVRATGLAVEAVLAAHLPRVSAVLPVGRTEPAPHLRVLGVRDATIRLASGTVELSGRHAEILLLLAEHPAGLSAEELAVLLTDGRLSPVTVRAEVSRLRRAVGALLASSRPYRLTSPLRSDLEVVRDALGAGDLPRALATYVGPVLPRSQAPGVVLVRQAVHADLRAAVFASTDRSLIARWAASDAGSQDWWSWRRLMEIAPAGSGDALRAQSRLACLDHALR